MTPALAAFLVDATALYLGAGLLFAIAFVIWGASRIDPAAHDMPWSARLLILPGSAALWPLMLAKWLARKPPPIA